MKITTFCYSLIFLCAGFCCPEEDLRESENYEIERDNLIEIKDSQTVFSLNDTLWIKTEVPLELEYEEQNLNISQIAGNSDRLYSYFGLYEQTNFENPLEIILSENEVISKTGDISTGSALTATAYLEGSKFISEFGIILKQEGTFVLSSSYRPGAMTLYVDSSNNTSVYIYTTFKDSENTQGYSFVVE